MKFSQVYWPHAQFRTASERSLDDFPHDLKSLDMLGRFNSVSSVLMSATSILKQVRRIASRYDDMLLSKANDYHVSSRGVKLLATEASRGGVDIIKIGDYTIHALNVFSAHRALVRAVLLARNLFEACLKPVVSKSIFGDRFGFGGMPFYAIFNGLDFLHFESTAISMVWHSFRFPPFAWIRRRTFRIGNENTDHRGVKFSVTTASKGGVHIKIGSSTIHAPRYSSARHPVIQMMLHAVNLFEDTFWCPKSMVPNRILDMIQRSCLWKVYEAGWTPAKRQPHPRSKHETSEANPTGSIWGSTDSCNGTSLPVLFDVCGRIETISTATGSGPAAATPPAYAAEDDDDDAAYYDAMSDAEAVDSVCMQSLATGIDNCKYKVTTLAPSRTLREQNNLNSLDDSNGTLPPNKKVIDFGSACMEGLQGLAGTKQEQHSAVPDSRETAERCTIEEEEEEKSGAATWLVATAAPNHATGNRSLLTGFTTEVGLFVEAGDGERMPVLGRGSVVTDAVVLPDVLFVPGLAANLVSVSKLAELDYSIGFARGGCYIRSATDGKVVGKAHVGEDGLFELDFLKVPPAF